MCVYWLIKNVIVIEGALSDFWKMSKHTCSQSAERGMPGLGYDRWVMLIFLSCWVMGMFVLVLSNSGVHSSPAIPTPVTGAHTSCLPLNADDHNWWTTMPPMRKERNKMKTMPARHFQVGYIHNQRSIKTMSCKNRPNSQQQPLKWLKMHCI